MTFTRSEHRQPALPTGRFPWLILLVLSLATFVTVTSEMAPAALLPQISQGLRVSQPRAGLLVSAWALTIAVSSLLLVRVTERMSRRSLLCWALVILVAANVATALAPSFGLALLGRVAAAAAHGVFWSVVVVYGGSLVADQHVGRALSVILAGPTLAGILGVPTAAAVGEVVSWRSVFGLLALVTGAAAVLLRLLLPDPRTGLSGTAPDLTASGRRSRGRSWDESSWPVLLVAVCASLILVAHFAVFTYVSTLLTDVGGFSRASVAPLLFVFGLAGAGGLAAAAFLSDRLPRAALVITAWLFALALASLTLLGHGLVASLTALVAWGALIGLLPPVLQARVLRTASARFRNTAGAVMITALNVGIAAGAAVGALVVRFAGAADLPVVATVLVAAAALGITALALRSNTPGLAQ